MGWSYLAGIGMYVAAAVAGCGGLALARRQRLAKRKKGGKEQNPQAKGSRKPEVKS